MSVAILPIRRMRGFGFGQNQQNEPNPIILSAPFVSISASRRAEAGRRWVCFQRFSFFSVLSFRLHFISPDRPTVIA
jgi:hypothetical protein